ncbi:hypothetical protein BH09ACT3_BH09ACT3_03490 [soil metagenome]
MALTRKQKKELKRLRSAASDIWDDQREVLEEASKAIRDATRHLAEIGREDVAPRVVAAGRSAASSASDKLRHDVLPAVSSALGSAIAVLDVAKNPQLREALGKAGKAGSALGAKAGLTPAKSSGPGKYILIGVGVVALAGIAYAAWQTLRADDELWVSDELEDDSAN